MCVNHINMVPVYYNVVSRQSCNTGLACTKCRAISASEKGLDIGELWRSRHAMPVAVAHAQPEVPPPQQQNSPSAFKIWRRGTNQRNSTVATPDQTIHKKDHHEDMSLLKFLAINALDLTVPASDVLLKSRNNQWFQLSGHPDSLAPAGPGTVWKKRAGGPDDTERCVYEQLSADPHVRDIIPKYFREVDYQGEKFIELQDLLHGFQDPYVMDIKMGTRTFLESEVKKSTARNDLYQKMIAIDPNAPTAEEHRLKAVTKLRYMQFREQQSSTCSQGFRIEAMKVRGAPPMTDLKRVKSRTEVMNTMILFLNGREDIRQRFLNRLHEIRSKFEQSEYFRTHEVVGSSIFMIYDDSKVGIWIIDFAKTNKLPEGIQVNHRKPWIQGNHEEGFLFGLDQLISVLEEIKFSPSPLSCGGKFPNSLNTIPVKS